MEFGLSDALDERLGVAVAIHQEADRAEIETVGRDYPLAIQHRMKRLQHETIAAGNFTNKNRRTFSYKKPKESPGAISKIDIDLDKCTFKISVKGAQNLEAAGSVFLGITIGPTFNQTDAIDL